MTGSALIDAWADGAAYLHERAHGALGSGEALEEGEREDILTAWRVEAYLTPEIFTHRVAAAGLDGATFAAAASGRAGAARGAATAWAAELAQILDLDPATVRDHELVTKAYSTGFGRLPFAALLNRLLTFYESELSTSTESRLSAPLLHDLLTALANRLLAVAVRTLILEINVARVEDRLHGATPQARYDDYASRLLADPAYLRKLFTEYPVLGRLLVETGHRWLRHSCELLDRLSVDRPALGAAGLLTSATIALARVDLDCGDSHGDGRSVAIAHFSDGSSLVYKPRPLGAEATYASAVEALNELLPDLGLRAMATMRRGGYGWCEHLAHTACANATNVPHFYQRAGAALALLLYLGAQDCHLENVIAAGDQFVPIDLESILQHKDTQSAGTSAHEKAVAILNDSVLAIGVLPMRVFGGAVGAGLDLSSLGGGVGDTAAVEIPMILDSYADTMHIDLGTATAGGAKNRPFVADGTPVDPMDHEDDVMIGFTSAYEVIAEHPAIFAALLGDSEQVAVRHILRPTRRYAMLLNDSYHPDRLRDGLLRDQLLDRLWLAIEARPELEPVIESEKRQLLSGDIPCFRASAGTTTLFPADDGGAIPDFFARPSRPALHRRLASLGPAHLHAQRRIIGDTMRARRGRFTASVGTVQMPGSHDLVAPPEPEVLTSLAHDQLQNLVTQMIPGDSDATWIGIGMQGVREDTFDYRPLGTTLYDGLAGMALTFAYAADVLADDQYLDIATRCTRPLLRQLANIARDGTSESVGAFSGLSGIVFSLDHIAVLTGDDEIFAAVADALPLLARGAAQEVAPDVVGGLAGAALVTAGLRSHATNPHVRTILDTCLDKLLATSVPVGDGLGWAMLPGLPPIGGFSHGSAGIGAALGVLGRELDEAAATAAAHRAWVFDSALFVPADGGWRDLRAEDTDLDPEWPYAVQWCHGATGIGLSRVMALQFDPTNAALAREAVSTLDTVALRGFNGSDCLCHGSFGNLDLFAIASQLLPDPGARAVASRHHSRLSARVVKGLHDRPPVCGLGTGMQTPGLMLGLAGVAHGLLRLLAPDRVPSVLSLQPPYVGSPSARAPRRLEPGGWVCPESAVAIPD